VPATALNVAMTEPAGTDTLDGTLTGAPLVETETVAPPGPAGLDKDNVQVAALPGVRVLALQLRDDTAAAATRSSETFWVLPFRVAVISTTPLAATLPTLAENVPEVEPAGTVTSAGTVSAGLLLARDMFAPPAPAGLDSVTVQLAVAPVVRFTGEH